MIREFEKKRLLKIDFCNKQLILRKKFVKRTEILVIPKNELLTIFKTLGYKFTYATGGIYNYDGIIYKDYKFLMYFQIKYNSPLAYMPIFKDGKLMETGITQFGSVLRFLPYDESLINNNFGINSVQEMQEYLKGLIDLFHEFVDEYIKEIVAGNLPE